jgi:glycosyltransferase involved in cell wall biosynthesis
MRLVAKVNRAKAFSFEWLAARLETFAVPRSEGVVCITRYTQDAVAPLAKRTWVVPNAVDSRFFEVQPEPESPPIILCVGNICLRKNQNRLIQALDPLAQRARFKLIFLGRATNGYDYDDEFFGLLKTRSWCAYEGFADRAKLRDYLRRATLLALPSLEDNCPMVVLEAMAAGVPVVAAKVGGVPDLIEEDRTGYFCDPLNAESMRAAIGRGVANPAEALELARLARQRARERFHPLVIARRHVEIYREVLGQGGNHESRHARETERLKHHADQRD